MPSPPNWDASNALWSYNDVRFVSPPTSLLIAGGHTSFLCTHPDTLNLVSGRLTTWSWHFGTLHALWILFRNQHAVGGANYTNCYVAYLWRDRAKFWYYKDGAKTDLEDDFTGFWPADVWYKFRLTWWQQISPQCQKTLYVKGELLVGEDWIQKFLWEDPLDRYSDTGLARCGFHTIDYVDDTLIEAVS